MAATCFPLCSFQYAQTCRRADKWGLVCLSTQSAELVGRAHIRPDGSKPAVPHTRCAHLLPYKSWVLLYGSKRLFSSLRLSYQVSALLPPAIFLKVPWLRAVTRNKTLNPPSAVRPADWTHPPLSHKPRLAVQSLLLTFCALFWMKYYKVNESLLHAGPLSNSFLREAGEWGSKFLSAIF